MNPSQKASHIIDKYREAAKGQIFAHWGYHHKQCALICVEEIIESCNRINEDYGPIKEGIHYWEEVKKEITNQ